MFWIFKEALIFLHLFVINPSGIENVCFVDRESVNIE